MDLSNTLSPRNQFTRANIEKSKVSSPMRREISGAYNKRKGFARQLSASPVQLYESSLSPLKRAVQRKNTLHLGDDTPARIAKAKRKITNDSFEKMVTRRLHQQEIKKFPLQNLTEDETDNFTMDTIASKLYELVHFYRVHKKSISQTFNEIQSQDHRLGYFLECIQEIDVILPILNQV